MGAKYTHFNKSFRHWNKSVVRYTVTICMLLLSSMYSIAQQPVQVIWPLTSDGEAVYSSGIGSALFTAGPGLANFRYDSINGATATGWNSRNLNPNAYFEYTIAPERDATLLISKLKFEVSLSSVNMRTALYYSKDGFEQQSVPMGNTVFVGKKSSRDLLVETAITVTYPEILSIRIYGWSAPNPAVNFFARDVEIRGVIVEEEEETPPVTEADEPAGGNRAPLGSNTFTSSGSWLCPTGVTSVTVECWGGGGRGGARTNGNNIALAGGGGGAYSRSILSVTPGNTYTVTVGSGSNSATTSGGDSWFNAIETILAKGGGSVTDNSNTRGAEGLANQGVGDIKYDGGRGAAGVGGTSGGGGGSSAGTGASGNYTNNQTTISGGTAPTGGGNGGEGAALNDPGNSGITPGGGGGGGFRAGYGTTEAPGNGADGQVIITWTTPAGYCEGNAISVVTSTGVPDPNDALGVPNNNGAQLNEIGDAITLMLTNGDLLLSGGSVNVHWRRNSSNNTIIQVELSQDGTNWTNYGNVTNINPQNTWLVYSIPLSVNTRYIRFTSQNGYDLDLDAISFHTPCAPPCTNPVITAQPVNRTICANSNTSFSVTATGTNLTYQWQVNTGAGWNNVVNGGVYGGATSATLTLTGVPASYNGYLYRCIVFSQGCNTTSSIVTLTVETASQPSVITGATSPCIGSSQTYSVTNITGTTYAWTVPTGWSITAGQGSNSITVTVGATGGNISVTPSNTCGNGPPGTLVVTTSTVPAQPSAITGNTTPCSGTSQVYSVVDVPGVTYNWTFPGGWTQTGGGTSNSVTVTVGNTAGNITVTPTNACGNGTATALAVTPLSAPAQPSVISGNTSPCQGSSQVYSVTNVTGVTYTWTFPAGWSQTAGGTTNSVTVTVGAAGGNITVTPSNTCGNGTSQSLAVTVQSLPAQTGPITPATTEVCQNSTHNFMVNPPPPAGVTYTWTGPPGSSVLTGQGTNLISIRFGNQSGTLTITPSNSCGNGPSQSLNITVSAGTPAMPGPITGNIAPCVGSSKTYSVPDLGLLYTWSVPTGWTIVSGQNTASINVTVGATTGNITVTAGNPCGASQPRTLLVTPQPGVPAQPSDITGANPVCAGSIQSYSVINVPFAIYTWSVSGAGWAINSGNGSNSITVTVGTANGTITVTPSNDCGIGTPRSKTITVDLAPPAQTSVITGPLNPCESSTQNYSVVNVPGVTYTWTIPSDWTLISPQGLSSISVTVGKLNGNITVIPSNGCGNGPASLLPVTVFLLPLDPGTITGPVEFCEGTTVNYSVTAVPGVTCQWQVPADWGAITGQGTNSISVIAGELSGFIIVTPSNACGSGPSSKLQVVVNPLPEAYTIEDGDICVGQHIFIGGPAVPGNTYSWTANPTGEIFNNLISNPEVAPVVTTTYTLIETNTATGCSNTNSVTVFTDQIIVLTVNPPSRKQTICTGGQTDITITSNIIGTQFEWGTTLVSGTATYNTTGTGNHITETIINTSGIPAIIEYQIKATVTPCENNDISVIVTVNPAPINNNQAQNLCSDSPSGLILATSTNGLPIASYTILSINANGLSASAGTPLTGTGFAANALADDAWTNTSNNPVNVIYTLQGVSSEGCIGNIFNVTLTINPEPVVTNNPDKGICSGASTNISLTSSIPSTFTWTIGTITGGITGATAGSGNTINQTLSNPSNSITGTVQYIITPTSTTGTCQGNPFIITVSVYPGPIITNSATKRICSGTNTDITLSASTPSTFTWTLGTNAGEITGALPGSGSAINQILSNPSNAISGSIQYIVTATAIAGGCISSNFTITVIVDPIPAVWASANPMSVCPGEEFDLFSTSSLIFEPESIVSLDFEDSFNGVNGTWNVTSTPNNSNGRWTIQDDGFQYNNLEFHSNDKSKFCFARSRQINDLKTYLTSPSFSTIGFDNLTLTFYHYFQPDGNSFGKVQIRIGNNGTWQEIKTFSDKVGTSNEFVLETIFLDQYVNYPNVYIRFYYDGNYDRYWAIDNINIQGSKVNTIPQIAWISNTSSWTSSEQNPSNNSQTESSTYTVSYTNSLSGCSASASTMVITKPLPNAQISADYCIQQQNGCIQLTASGGGSYIWHTIPPTFDPVICVNEAGVYSVDVTLDGCTVTTYSNVSNEEVVNGNFENGNNNFVTGYQYRPDLIGIQDELWPEGTYSVGSNAYNYHTDFFGLDRTNPGTGQFMIVNGLGSELEIWRQDVNVAPNSDYYFSAWAMSLNDAGNYAQLQFEVNGVRVGNIANLGPGPANNSQVSPSNWIRFNNIGAWHSGSNTTARIRIINLRPNTGGNDFGLDDISFGTLDPVPFIFEISANGGSNIACEGGTLQFFTDISGGMPPYIATWTGPNGFISHDLNPFIDNVTLAMAGVYTLTIHDSYGCTDQSQTLRIEILPAPNATISDGGNYCQFAAQPLIYLTAIGGTPPFTFEYNINGGATQTATTWGTDNYTIVFASTNVTGTFVYTITSVTDGKGCTRNTNVSTQIVVNPLPSAYITGDWSVCPNTLNQYEGNSGLSLYNWTVSGNGSIPGAANNQLVDVQSGIQCDVPFTLDLVVTDINNCNATAQQLVMVDDIENPVINCPVTGTQTVIVNSGNVYIHTVPPAISWDATATDNCHLASITATLSGATTGTLNSLNGATFNQGTTTVTWTATDDCGNSVTCSFIVEVMGTADLQVIKTGPANITAGETITYTITVTNNGPATAPTVTVTDALPAAIGAPFTWSLNGILQVGAWPGSYVFNNLAVGATGQQVIIITGKVNCSATTFTNTATAALGTLTDPDLTNNTSSVTTTIQNPLQLSAVVTNSECNEEGAIDLTVTGGTAPYSYLWTTADGIIPTGQETGEDLTGLTSGTYHVVVTDDNGCTIENEWAVISEDTEPPVITVPTAPSFCVVDIFSAVYDGQPEPAADIVPDPLFAPPYPVDWHRPDWYILNGTTELDITATDNCCPNYTIDWVIEFAGNEPGQGDINGTGQPSARGPIVLWGTPLNVDVTHTITYTITDCNGNTLAPISVDIIIKPRPDVIKQ